MTVTIPDYVFLIAGILGYLLTGVVIAKLVVRQTKWKIEDTPDRLLLGVLLLFLPAMLPYAILGGTAYVLSFLVTPSNKSTKGD